jgi:uncharacterized membrane protein YebE (DUF533 family)
MKKCIALFLSLNLFLASAVFAQDNSEDIVKNTQQDILLVAAAGAGGAILGLSTLSFYDTASKHISNIWTGAALGVIAGVIIVAYNSAQKGSEDLVSKRDFGTSERTKWHNENDNLLSLQTVQFGTQFWQSTF